MSRELLIEKMARALCAYDVRLEPDEIGDPGYEAQAAIHVDKHWRNYVGDVTAILSLLSDPANITDEMVEAARAACWEAMVENHASADHPIVVRRAIAAAFAERAP